MDQTFSPKDVLYQVCLTFPQLLCRKYIWMSSKWFILFIIASIFGMWFFIRIIPFHSPDHNNVVYCFHSAWEYFAHTETSLTFGGEGLQNSDQCSALRSLLSKEWSLSCYICCKTGLWFLWTRMKDHANVVVCFRKQGLIADDLSYLGSPREGWGLVPGEVLQWFVRDRFLKVLSNPCLSQGD